MRSLLSELARVSHSAQVTGRGGFQGHAGLKNRGARATGHGTPTRSAWPGARLPLGSERALPPGPGARRGHRAGPSPTLEGWRTPRGSVRLEKHTASLRACPAKLTERTEPRAPLLPNNHAPHRRNNASPGFSESTSPRVHRRPGREEPAGPRRREGWVAREVRRPAPQAAPSPAFSQCVAGAWPRESWPRPSPAGRVTQAGPAGSAPPSASSAHDFPGPAAIPPGRGAARRLRPRRQPGLGRRGPSHCDAAVRRGLRCLPPPRPEPLLTRISGRPPTLGRRRVALAGPAEVWPRPSAPGLPRLELRATRRPLLLLLPCPPAGPPPPAAAAAAACTTQPPPSRRPSAAPRPPGFTGSGDRGAKLWGREGRNAPPSASGAGEPRNRRRHRLASGGAGGAPKPPARRPRPPIRGEAQLGAGISTCDPWPLLPERRAGHCRTCRILRQVFPPPSRRGGLSSLGFPPLRTPRGG